MFPFNHDMLEFQAMVAAGPTSLRAFEAAMSIAAEHVDGVMKAGRVGEQKAFDVFQP